MKRSHAMPFGAALLEGGGTRFRLWAPGAARIGLMLAQGAPRTMNALEDGWHELVVSDAWAGTRYQFVLPDGLTVPDPASRFNPDDISGPSEVVDPRAYAWRDRSWRGRPWHEAVIYELHLGSFTSEGTLAAAQARLAELAELGITALELMPLAEFPGKRNWGYDGVLPFAPDAAYGTPEELKAFVDTAHALKLMVLLDVVYNHFGPQGNFLHAYCPQFFNPKHATPWGAAINFDGEMSREVRAFFVHNALYWIEEYRFDGLRLDAVHAIRDDSTVHIVKEIARALREGPGRGREVHLVLENGANEARFLERGPDLAPRYATAQWNDDLHHAVHVLTTGEKDGYYADFADAPLEHLGRTLAQGFAFQGQVSPFHDHKPRGEPSGHLPGGAFVSFLQSHDQVGNRAFGERIHAIGEPRLLAAAYACVLLSPHAPMLFMGEEYAASTPFQYFCDFHDELAEAVRNGRREEFKRFAAFRDPGARARIPDPNARQTFAASRLDWAERSRTPQRRQLALVRELLALRREHLVPRLASQRGGGRYRVEGSILRVEWTLDEGSRWRLLAHFGHGLAELKEEPAAGTPVYVSGVHQLGAGRARLEPGAVRVTLEAARG